MTADEIFAKATVDVITKTGKVTVFIQAGELTEHECSIIIDRGVVFDPPAFETHIADPAITVDAILAELPGVPKTDSTFVNGEETLTVVDIIANDGFSIRAVVK